MKTFTALTFFCICFACTTPEVEVEHLEIMTFRLNRSVTDHDFTLVNKEVNLFLKTQAGFVSREIGKVNDSTWIDVLRWQSQQHFEEAFTRSAEDDGVKRMSAMINFDSLVPLSFSTQPISSE